LYAGTVSHITNGATELKVLHYKPLYGVGTHFVELTSTNGCVYKQSFTISEAVDPVIDSVIEQGNSLP
jgi:hypothetical protein